MAIKLVYTAIKDEEENKRHLYASLTGIPAEDDEQLAFDPAYNPETQISFYTKSASNGIRVLSFNDSRRGVATKDDATMQVTAYGYDVLNNVKLEEKPRKQKKSSNKSSERKASAKSSVAPAKAEANKAEEVAVAPQE